MALRLRRSVVGRVRRGNPPCLQDFLRWTLRAVMALYHERAVAVQQQRQVPRSAAWRSRPIRGGASVAVSVGP